MAGERLAQTSSWEGSDGQDTLPRRTGVLIADEKGLTLTSLKFELEPLGFSVWLAMDGDDALDLYRRHRTEIDIVLLDAQLPGLEGSLSLAKLRKLNPSVLACLMKDDSVQCTELELLDHGAVCVFQLPLCPVDVAQRLLQLVESIPRSISTPRSILNAR